MKIASWNVNSIRARHDRLIEWLSAAEPDVLCIQELKGPEESFPFESIREAGYHAVVYGQKTYNGVAILGRHEPKDVERGFGKRRLGEGDPQARLIAATVDDAIHHEDHATALTAMVQLRQPLATFFDDVLVMAEDERVRANRIALLTRISEAFGRIADFAAISTD